MRVGDDTLNNNTFFYYILQNQIKNTVKIKLWEICAPGLEWKSSQTVLA